MRSEQLALTHKQSNQHGGATLERNLKMEFIDCLALSLAAPAILGVEFCDQYNKAVSPKVKSVHCSPG